MHNTDEVSEVFVSPYAAAKTLDFAVFLWRISEIFVTLTSGAFRSLEESFLSKEV
jgi:hypothetical protein